jgi:hypothetical protein
MESIVLGNSRAFQVCSLTVIHGQVLQSQSPRRQCQLPTVLIAAQWIRPIIRCLSTYQIDNNPAGSYIHTWTMQACTYQVDRQHNPKISRYGCPHFACVASVGRLSALPLLPTNLLHLAPPLFSSDIQSPTFSRFCHCPLLRRG